MSALPKNVQDQVSRANELIEQIYPSKELDEDGNPVEAKEDDIPAAESKPTDDKPPAAEQPPAQPTDWEHKFRVLQGKYNAEVPRLQRDLRDSQDANSELRQRLNNVETMMAAMQASKQGPEEEKPTLPDISQEEREQFGEDLIDLIERVSKRATLPEIQQQLRPLEGRVKQVGDKVAHTETSVAESKRQQVFEILAKAVPDWEQQNVDPKFLDWLDEPDAFSGRKRGDLMAEAMGSFDAKRIVALFKGFRSENAAVQPAPTPAPTETQGSGRPEPQVKLEELTAPGTPQTGTDSAPNESGKRVWTRADIAKFYADKNEYIKKGRPLPKRMKALEEDLFKAQAEGRLR